MMDTTQLVMRARGNDQQALAELYEISRQPAYAVAFKMTGNNEDAEDILQAAYMKAFSSLDQLAQPEGFVPWFNKIVANKCKDFLRSRKNVTFFSDMNYDDGEDSVEIEFEDTNETFQPEAQTDYSDVKRIMEAMLNKLPEDQKIVLLMRYIQDMPIRDIAESLGVSESTVKSRLRYGEKKLRMQAEALERNGYKLRISASAAIPFLIWMLKDFAAGVAAPPASAVIGAAAGAAGASAGAAAGAVSGAAAGAAGASAAGASSAAAGTANAVAGSSAGAMAGAANAAAGSSAGAASAAAGTSAGVSGAAAGTSAGVSGAAAGTSAGAAAGTSAGAAAGSSATATVAAAVSAKTVAVIAAGAVAVIGGTVGVVGFAVPAMRGEEVKPYSVRYDRGNPPEWQKRSDGKIYFYADPAIAPEDYKDVYVYIYSDTYDSSFFVWGSKKGRMTDEGNNIWSFDPAQKGYRFSDNASYCAIFSYDWSLQSCDLIIGNDCLGDMAYLTGGRVENSVDSNKQSYIAEWVNADPEVYATPIRITSLGNVIGEVPQKGQTTYSLFRDFLLYIIDSAVKYNQKTREQTIDDVAETLGLTREEKERAIAEAANPDDSMTANDPYIMSLEEVREHRDEFLAIGRETRSNGYELIRMYYKDGCLRFEYVAQPVTDGYAQMTSSYVMPVLLEDGTVTVYSGAYPNESAEETLLWENDSYSDYADR